MFQMSWCWLLIVGRFLDCVCHISNINKFKNKYVKGVTFDYSNAAFYSCFDRSNYLRMLMQRYTTRSGQ